MTALRLVTGLLLALAGLSVHAERAQQAGVHEIHYNAIPTALLQPAVAKRYGIPRSRRRALVTVSVLRGDTPVTAQLYASAENTAGQVREIDLREVHDGTAIYYLGTTSISPPERLDIELRVQPDGAPKTYTVTFRQRFYTDE